MQKVKVVKIIYLLLQRCSANFTADKLESQLEIISLSTNWPIAIKSIGSFEALGQESLHGRPHTFFYL